MGLTAKKVYAILNGKIKKLSGDVSSLGTPLFYAGSVGTADLLPLYPTPGAVYNIEQKSIYGESGTNVAWNGVLWDAFGSSFDLSLLLTKEEAENTYFKKNQGIENAGKALIVGTDGNITVGDMTSGDPGSAQTNFIGVKNGGALEAFEFDGNSDKKNVSVELYIAINNATSPKWFYAGASTATIALNYSEKNEELIISAHVGNYETLKTHCSLNEKVHVLITYEYQNNEATRSAYVNGKAIGSKTGNQTPSAGFTDAFVNLDLIEISVYSKRIWDRVLTENDAIALYNNGKPQDFTLTSQLKQNLVSDLNKDGLSKNGWTDSVTAKMVPFASGAELLVAENKPNVYSVIEKEIYPDFSYDASAVRNDHDCTFINDEFVTFSKPSDTAKTLIYIDPSTWTITKKNRVNFVESNGRELENKSVDYKFEKLIIGNGRAIKYGETSYLEQGAKLYIFHEANGWRNIDTDTEITFNNCGKYDIIDISELGFKVYGFWGGSDDLVFVSCNLFNDIVLIQLGKGTNNLGRGIFVSNEDSTRYNGSFKIIRKWHQDGALEEFSGHGGQFYNGHLYIATNDSNTCTVYRCNLMGNNELTFDAINLFAYDHSGKLICKYIDGICIKDDIMYAQPLHNGDTYSGKGVIKCNLNDLPPKIDFNKPKADAITENASGDTIVLNDSSEAPLKNFQIFGKTEQLTTTGAQLIERPYVDGESKTMNGVQFTVESDGGIRVKGTATADALFILSRQDFGNDSAFHGNAYVANGKTFSGAKDNVKMEYHGGNKMLYLSCDSGKTFDTTVYPQVQDGSVATPYEPYTGGKPSPSPDYPQEIINAGDNGQIEIRVYKKNLFNISKFPGEHRDESIFIDGRITDRINISNGIKFDKNTIYCISWESYVVTKPNGDWTSVFGFEYTDGTWEEAYLSLTSKKTIKSSANKTVKYVYYKNPWDVGIEINKVQIEKGTERTTYESFKTQSVILTSDRPLTKWDKLDKRDGVWGWVYKSGEKVIDGTEKLYINSGYKGDNTTNAYLEANDMQKGLPTVVMGFCNKLGFLSTSWSAVNDGKIGFCYNSNQIHLRLDNNAVGILKDDTIDATKQKISTFLKNEFDNGKPFIFVYETKIETFVPLSELEQKALNELTTYYPTTVISNDVGANMEISYIADTKNYINKKFAEIQTALVNTNAQLLNR